MTLVTHGVLRVAGRDRCFPLHLVGHRRRKPVTEFVQGLAIQQALNRFRQGVLHGV